MSTLLIQRLKLAVEHCMITSIAGVIYQLLTDGIVTHMALIMGSALGFGFGILEIFILSSFQKLFSKLPFLITICSKALLYLLIINIFSGAIGLFVGLMNGLGIDDFYKSMLSKEQLVLSFYTLIIYVLLSFYTQINLLLGEGVFFKFLVGRYRKPIEENRIFMFLDLKSSTTIAEKLGLEKYYDLLNDFFHEISEPVRATKAEVYQYVGDEVIFTWKTKEGIENSNCLNIFFKIQEKVNNKRAYYKEKYDVVPEFKAGLHYGSVISAQIGDIKREIIYNGDVLNTSARIQEQCNEFNKKLILSGELLNILDIKNEYVEDRLASIRLKGKERSIELFGIQRN